MDFLCNTRFAKPRVVHKKMEWVYIGVGWLFKECHSGFVILLNAILEDAIRDLQSRIK
jgi:hypothetical protein